MKAILADQKALEMAQRNWEILIGMANMTLLNVMTIIKAQPFCAIAKLLFLPRGMVELIRPGHVLRQCLTRLL